MKCAKLRCDRKSDPMIPLRPLPLRRRTAAAVWLIIIQECHTQQQKRVGWEITNCYVGNDSGCFSVQYIVLLRVTQRTRWFLALRVESSRMIISSNHVQCMNVMLCNCCTMTSTKCQRIILGGRKYANKRRILFYYITILSAMKCAGKPDAISKSECLHQRSCALLTAPVRVHHRRLSPIINVN